MKILVTGAAGFIDSKIAHLLAERGDEVVGIDNINDYYDAEATLTIAGGGRMYFDYSPYECLKYIKLINRYIPTEELAGLLQQCDFTVCPYTDATQSGVIMTSFTMSKPVVATNVGALGEMIEDGKTGVLIPPKDTEALADAMISLLNDENRLKQMSETISTTYHSGDWDWNNIAKKYLS